MKALQALLLATVLLSVGLLLPSRCAAGEMHDYRFIDGTTVDIQPVRNWYQTRQGPRPMPRWRPLDIHGIVGHVGVWQKCWVRDEHGKEYVIYVRHLPGFLVRYFRATTDLNRQIAQLSTQLQYNASLSPKEVAVKTQQLEQLQAKRNSFARQAQLEFVRYSGIKCGEIEMWDCGLKM